MIPIVKMLKMSRKLRKTIIIVNKKYFFIGIKYFIKYYKQFPITVFGILFQTTNYNTVVFLRENFFCMLFTC